MLSFKPIIALTGGEVVPVERPRTRAKAYSRVAQLLGEQGPLEAVAVVETNEEVGQQLGEAIQGVYSGELPHYDLGAVIGTHTGPGTAALAGAEAEIVGMAGSEFPGASARLAGTEVGS